MKVYSFLLSLGLTCKIFAQSTMPQIAPDTAGVYFSKTIQVKDLQRHLFKLASAEMEGRKTATKGQKKAALYLAQEMKRIGLKPANPKNKQNPYLQTFKLERSDWEYSLGSRLSGRRQNTTLVTTENVVGWIEGSDKKDEYIIISGHYDHEGIQEGKIYFGADDNASGVSSILEIAEAFMLAKKAGFTPRRSIVFLLLTAEEVGLLGSRYYADFQPLFPLEKTIVDLNVDMIGRIDKTYTEKQNEEYVYIIGSDKISKELDSIQKAVNQRYTKITLDYTYNDPLHPEMLYYRSDHYNFAKKNIPIIFYFSGLHEDYHQPTDTPEKIHYPKMAKIAQLIFLTAWEIANREERLRIDKKNDK
ncbi:MAG: M28 family metallopeptidase [Raineya sp.]|nr:M28 family metallopeptidase [Raineya sp.]